MADNQKGWRVLAGLVVVVVAFVGYRWSSDRGDDRVEALAEEFASATEPVTITYEVDGTTTWADVTMETPDGTEQISPDVPLTRTASGERGLEYAFSAGDFVYVSAQNNERTGTVTCIIRASDGTVIAKNTSSGAFAIATCEGSAR